MYYLQSRYYDPALRRFINADDPSLIEELAKSSVIGSNLFGYCGNNGIIDKDHTGFIPWRAIAVITTGVVYGLVSVFSEMNTRRYKRATGGGKVLYIFTSFVLGFVKGALTAIMVLSGGKLIYGIVSSITYVYDYFKSLKGKKPNKWHVINAALNGFSVGVTLCRLGKIVGRLKSENARVIINALTAFGIKKLLKW